MSDAPTPPFKPMHSLPVNELFDLKPADPCYGTGTTGWSVQGSSGCWYWDEKQTERWGGECFAGLVGIDSVVDRRPMQSAEPNEADQEAC